jgi:hypothetical protein
VGSVLGGDESIVIFFLRVLAFDLGWNKNLVMKIAMTYHNYTHI